jgi:hypothetical protein
MYAISGLKQDLISAMLAYTTQCLIKVRIESVAASRVCRVLASNMFRQQIVTWNRQLAKAHVASSSSQVHDSSWQGWPAKIRLRPGIASGRGPLLHRRDLVPLPLFATQTTTTERIRDIQSHGVASTQQTPPSNHPDLTSYSPTFYLDPCNIPTPTTRTALTRPINIIPPACRGDAAVRSWNGANLRPRHSSSCLP